MTGGAGRALAVVVTPGLTGEMRPAHGPRAVLAERGTLPVIAGNPPAKPFQPFDRAACRAGHAIERTFGRLRDRRRIHARYDRLARTIIAAVASRTACRAAGRIAAGFGMPAAAGRSVVRA